MKEGVLNKKIRYSTGSSLAGRLSLQPNRCKADAILEDREESGQSVILAS